MGNLSIIPDLTLVVAVSQNGVIGRDQALPWRLKTDLQRFKRTTMGHGLIMGRKTFESIGRVLPGRTTIVLTRNPDANFPGALVAESLEMAVSRLPQGKIPFVVGGAQVYRSAMKVAERLLITRVLTEVAGDTFFDAWSEQEWRCVLHEDIPAGPYDEWPTRFEEWRRIVDGKVD